MVYTLVMQYSSTPTMSNLVVSFPETFVRVSNLNIGLIILYCIINHVCL